MTVFGEKVRNRKEYEIKKEACVNPLGCRPEVKELFAAIY